MADALKEVQFLPLAMSAHLNQVAESNPEWDETINDHKNKGLYVPDNIMLPVINKVFENFDAPPRLVIDGGTRTQAQAELFYKHLRSLGYVIHAFYIDTPHETCVERSLRRGRADDTEQVIMTRFEQFNRHTQPAIVWMRSQKESFIVINGTESPEVKIMQLFAPLDLLDMAQAVTELVDHKIKDEKAQAERCSAQQ